VDLLTDAFRELSERYPDIGLLIVGDGETLPAIQQKVQQWSCSNRIWFTGKLQHEDVFTYLQLMDCALMVKSNWYGSPVKIFEYGWFKKPIIAPATVPVQDVMEHGIDGLLIHPELSEITAAMEFFLKNRNRMQQMAEHFHSKIATQHLWRNNVQLVLKFLNEP
jgi:glycosyltransferase involved in cell wall biosynthesis